MSVLDECWEWGGARANGYGHKWLDGRHHRVHRLAWAWASWLGVGDWKDIPEDMHVLHECDNPACCNPQHLRLGTHEDNMGDKRERGRVNNWNAAKTHCKRGHEFTEDNTYHRMRNGRQQRHCLACRDLSNAKRYRT